MTNLIKSIFALGLFGFLTSCEKKATSATPATEPVPTPAAAVKNIEAAAEKTTEDIKEVVKEVVEEKADAPAAPKKPAAGAPT